MKRIVSVFLVVSLVFAFGFPAFAADGEMSLSEYTAYVEQKYAIDITYGEDNGRAAITANTLEILDRALSTMTGTLVRQVSAYYEAINGKRLEITYITSESKYMYQGAGLEAAFEKATPRIYVFMPSVAGDTTFTGENPISFVHEFAHAFHAMAENLYGREKMQNEWTAFNKGRGYTGRVVAENPDESVYVSYYSAYSYGEDFAEVFAHTFVRSAPGTGFKNQLADANGNATNLGKKVAYVERIIQLVLKDTDEAIANYRRIYSTATAVRFEGIRFSGEFLQFSGYPQPRNLLKGILNSIGRTSQKSTWIRSLGAWRVIDQTGDMLYVFPGGRWVSRANAAARGEAA